MKTTNEILKLTLIEIEKPALESAKALLEGIANNDSASGEMIVTDEELKKFKIEDFKESWRQSRERIKTTTVDDVLSGWSRKHEKYLAIKDRVFRQVHLSNLSTFFRHLISLGLPEEYLASLPSGQIVLDTKTVDEIFA